MLKYGLVFFLLEIVSKFFLKAYCTKPLKIKYNPCANQRKPYHIMQMPKNACSAMHTGRGVMSLVPIRQFI